MCGICVADHIVTPSPIGCTIVERGSMNAGISRCWTNRRLTVTSASRSASSIGAARAGRAGLEHPGEATCSTSCADGRAWRRRRARPPCRAPAAAASYSTSIASSASWAAGLVARDDDRDRLADVVDLVDGQARVARVDHVGSHRPRARDRALLVGEVLAGEGGDHARALQRAGDVDRGDLGVAHRAAQDRQVQHAGHGQVVGPGGAAGDQVRVLLALARLADLARRGRSATVVISSPPPWRRPGRHARCSGSRYTGTGCPRCPRGPRRRSGSGSRAADRRPT